MEENRRLKKSKLNSLIALAQANPSRPEFSEMAVNEYLKGGNSQIAEALGAMELEKFSGGDSTALSRIDTLNDGGYEAYKKTYTGDSKPDLTGLSDKEAEDTIAERYARAVAASQQNGDTTMLQKVKADYPEFDFNYNEKSGDVSARKRKKELNWFDKLFL